jgi:hypothetical protein
VEPTRSAQKRPVTSSATASLIRRSQPVMHRRIRLRDVPLPVRAFAAWPIRVVLPSVRIGGAPGVSSAPFAGLLPRRVAGHFCPAGPTCLLVQPRAPIDFRRVELPPLREQESSHSCGKSRVRSDWLLGLTPVCGPCLQASGSHVAASTPEDRSCLGLCLLQGCGHGACAFGRARPRPDHPVPRAP